MDFHLSEQQQMFRDSVATFARRELGDGALERAHAPRFLHEIAKKMAGAGLLGITIPEADGGADWAPIFFDNVCVPPEDVLLPAGGFKKQIQGFNAERIGNASRSLAYGCYC